ncbi:MAG: D-aminoacyl-tRNA deacylase [Evtepia sp.]
MRAVVTRVSSACVCVEDREIGKIETGFLILLGVGNKDTGADAKRLANKVCGLRVFEDERMKMNRSLTDVGGSLLVISQFTLYANTKSRRPGFTDAAKPELAIPLYELFLNECRAFGVPVACGVFGADMKVASVNDGPVTILFDTEINHS